jgi:hypothetical protein
VKILKCITQTECLLQRLEELGICTLTCDTGCFSTGMPFKYSTLSFPGGKIWLMTGSSFGTSDSRR